MKYVPLWICILAFSILPGCSAEETSETAPEVQTPDNTAAIETNPSSEPAQAQEQQKPVRVAQADTGEQTVTKIQAPQKASPYKAGTHYQILTPAQPTSSGPEQIEVAEAFMYGCPHCYTFEPFMEKWVPKQADNVRIVRIPVLFNRQAEVHARVFYTADALGVLDKTHLPFFREIHANRRAMTSERDLVEFFGRHGVDEDTFKKTFRSFYVEHKIRVARTLSQRYRISSVPTVIVNGKYSSVGSNLAGNDLLALMDHLVEKESSR
ncbi:MAG: thiol:disulfide interchange protein DsbA/DsbL [Pseudomonadota bacterium]